MAKNKTGIKTKEMILQAGLESFLESGYSGAKMEDIAEKAGITKAMLYYHFDCKENIMKEILSGMVHLARQNMENSLSLVLNEKKLDQDNLFLKIDTVLGNSQPILRLITREVMVGNLDIKEVLSLLKAFYEKVFQILTEKKMTELTLDEFMVQMLFFQGFPLILFYNFHEKVSEEFNINPKKLKKLFMTRFTDNYNRTILL